MPKKRKRAAEKIPHPKRAKNRKGRPPVAPQKKKPTKKRKQLSPQQRGAITRAQNREAERIANEFLARALARQERQDARERERRRESRKQKAQKPHRRRRSWHTIVDRGEADMEWLPVHAGLLGKDQEYEWLRPRVERALSQLRPGALVDLAITGESGEDVVELGRFRSVVTTLPTADAIAAGYISALRNRVNRKSEAAYLIRRLSISESDRSRASVHVERKRKSSARVSKRQRRKGEK